MDDKIRKAMQAVFDACEDDFHGRTYKAIKRLKELIEGPKRWVPAAKGNGVAKIFGDGRLYYSISDSKNSEIYINVGRAYESMEVAEYLRDEYMTPQALILRRAEEIYIDLGERWVADWKDSDQLKYYIYYGILDKKWGLSSNRYNKICGTAYMSERAARQIVEELNSGYIQLKTKGEENG